jgi:hypothetical protein
VNRYKSIVDNVVGDIAVQIESMMAQIPDAHWKAADGKLVAVVNGEEFDMSFAPGDPLTEALLMFLNNRSLIISKMRNS